MRFLIFGDVVGEPGREAVSRVLPRWREKYQPDALIINIENMAHGRGVSRSTIEEVRKWRADALTTGDHAWDNKSGWEVLSDQKVPIIRPANYPTGVPGRGYVSFNNGARKITVINLQGQVFFKNQPSNPFQTIDALLKQIDIKDSDLVLVDFHAEATSEKRAFGWHVDGRITAIWGTHTHVPTADAQILPQGTAYVTDAGMNGNYESIIGGSKSLLKGYLTQLKTPFEIDAIGRLEANGLLLEVDLAVKKAISIALLREIVNA